LKDIAIIGAGPAGIAASIYLKRAGFEPLVFEKGDIGGLLLNANLVENYPGFPEGITGKELVKLFKNQLLRLDIYVENKEVKEVNIDGDGFKLITSNEILNPRALIITSGTIPKDIELKGQSSVLGRKLFYEIKDIPPPKREDTFVVIGAGDAAFDYALNLSKDVSKVDIIFRSGKAKCLTLLEDRARKSKNIYVHPKTAPLHVKEEQGKIKIECISDGKETIFTPKYGLIACGRSPNLNVISKELQKSLRIKKDGTTNIPGLYFAGDVRRGNFRQTGIAVGDGISTAMMAAEFLLGGYEK